MSVFKVGDKVITTDGPVGVILRFREMISCYPDSARIEVTNIGSPKEYDATRLYNNVIFADVRSDDGNVWSDRACLLRHAPIEVKIDKLARIENQMKSIKAKSVKRKARKVEEICDIVAKGGSYLSVKDAEAIYDAVRGVS